MNGTAIVDKAQVVIASAQQLGVRVVTAESCTAGALATLLSDIPGAGEVLEGGFICYAKSFKNEVLAVDEKTLEQETAVSRKVALALTQGALDLSRRADIALAVTGVCGPKEDEDGNPIGKAWIALRDRIGGEAYVELQLPGDSTGQLRGEMMRAALDVLEEHLRAFESVTRTAGA
jgi:nicotinamide-nucleotide amidase